MLGPWGDLAGEVMGLIKADERLLRCLAAAPPKAFHGYAAWLRSKANNTPMEAARHALASSPKQLLAEALDQQDVSATWRALDRLPRDAQSANTYSQIDRIVRGPFSTHLWSFEEITPAVLGFFRDLEAAAGREPLVTPAARALVDAYLKRSGFSPKEFVEMIHVLRLFGLIDDMTSGDLGGLTSANALIRYLARRCRQIPIIKIDTTGSDFACARFIDDFYALAKTYRNCLRTGFDLMAAAVAGRLLLLEHLSEPRAVIALDVLAALEGQRKMVCVSEMRGPANGDLGDAEALIHAKLRALPTLALIERPLGHTLARLARRGIRLRPDDMDAFVRGLD
jgi:hypothetical protein